jgi:hypothetical protein
LNMIRIGDTGIWKRSRLRVIADNIWEKLRGMADCNQFRVARGEN